MRYSFFLALLLSQISFGQEFPKDWMGSYTGEMILSFEQRPDDTLDVDFTLAEKEKDSLWSYSMVYYSEKYGKITKDYLIRTKSKGDKKHFELDEQNGIIMELTLMNNTLYGMYQVLGDIYSSTMQHNGDHLYFDLYAVPTNDPITSKLDSEDQDIEAISYKPKLSQSVRLYRK